MMNTLGQVHQMVWGSWTLVMFPEVDIFFTLKCHFPQIRGFLLWWNRTAGRLVLGEASRKGGSAGKGKGISQFQSVCTVLVATVGTDDIAGVTTTLTAGGPGTLFWIWISALIDMITAYTGTTLGIRYRHRGKDGHHICGPFIYMERRLGFRGMGVPYSFLCLTSSLGMNSMTQANSAISTTECTWHILALISGPIFTSLLVLVIWGEIHRIRNMTGKLVPTTSEIYIAFSMIVTLSCLEQTPGALASMVASAFRPETVAGGTARYITSYSMRYGVSWEVLSNEAGLGTLTVLHGPTEDTTPHRQGMWAMFEVFFDAMVLCILAALVILCMTGSSPETVPCEGAALAAWCFSRQLGVTGEYLVSSSMVVFAFATIMAWFHLGRQVMTYFIRGCKFGGDAQHIFAARVYPLLFIVAVFLGGEVRLELVWLLSDVWGGLITSPNLTTLLFLSEEITPPGESLRRRD